MYKKGEYKLKTDTVLYPSKVQTPENRNKVFVLLYFTHTGVEKDNPPGAAGPGGAFPPCGDERAKLRR